MATPNFIFCTNFTSRSTKPEVEALPDPYNSLSHEMKRFVDNISVMGFPRARVARAAQKLGQDDKKVGSLFL